MTVLNLSNPDRPIRAGVILMNGVTELLDVAPIDFFAGLSKQFLEAFPPGTFSDEQRAQALDVEFHWVTEKGNPAKLTGGVTVQATNSFDTCPPLDIIIMGASLSSSGDEYIPNETELSFVRKSYDDCAAFISICGGMQIPLKAGLLKGKTATAPRFILGMLKENVADVNWVDERWHRDGKMWTSGALLNGLDLMRAFATETWGGEGKLADMMLDVGSFPRRKVDYSDD